MGDICNEHNIVGTIRAENQARGDIFSEAERLKAMSSSQEAAYESHMARLLGYDKRDVKKPNIYDVMGQKGIPNKGAKIWHADRMYGRPSEIFSAKFYDPIHKRHKAWSKTMGDDKAYRETISKPAKNVLNAIDQILTEETNPRKIDRQLAKFGLTASQVYDARRYLTWLSEGGVTQKPNRDIKNFIDTAGHISKAQSNANLLWSAGNVTDMLRVYSHFATKEGGGVGAIIRGTTQALKATKGNLFSRVDKLDKDGLYKSQYIDHEGANLDPFSWSVTMQKNIAYHLDLASGGDGYTGVRDTLFDAASWDRPAYDRSIDASSLVFGLARYPINETRWVYNTTKAALQGDKRAAANMLLFSTGKAALTGTRSMIPTFIWTFLSKDEKEAVTAFDSTMGFNVIKMATGGHIDVSGYTQLMGGSLGSRADSIAQTFQKTFGRSAEGVKTLTEGNLSATAANFVAAVLALNNMGGTIGKLEKLKLPNGLNSTTYTKVMEKTADFLHGEFGLDDLPKEMGKAFFGTSFKSEASGQ